MEKQSLKAYEKRAAQLRNSPLVTKLFRTISQVQVRMSFRKYYYLKV